MRISDWSSDVCSSDLLYAYDLEGVIVNKVTGLKRPNNADVAYGLRMGDTVVDIVVLTERETTRIRIFSLPGLRVIAGGGITVFEGEEGEDENDPMGLALDTRPADSDKYRRAQWMENTRQDG